MYAGLLIAAILARVYVRARAITKCIFSVCLSVRRTRDSRLNGSRLGPGLRKVIQGDFQFFCSFEAAGAISCSPAYGACQRGYRLLPDVQSAYRAYHSTETAVLKVLADIRALDTGDFDVLIPLDLSAAFDTV